MKKLAKCKNNTFEGISDKIKVFNGIGGAKVTTYGKRRLPTAIKLSKCQRILPGVLESHEQDGKHPLLLSDQCQAKLGFVKDMREGKIYLKDYDDYIDVYRAERTGLKVICVSSFPKKGSGYIHEFVEYALDGQKMSEKMKSRWPRPLSPKKGIANPAREAPWWQSRKKTVSTGSLGMSIEMRGRQKKVDRPDISENTIESIIEKALGDVYQVRWDVDTLVALRRRY